MRGGRHGENLHVAGHLAVGVLLNVSRKAVVQLGEDRLDVDPGSWVRRVQVHKRLVEVGVLHLGGIYVSNHNYAEKLVVKNA